MGEYIAYETIIANRSVMRQHSFTNPINKPYRKDYSIIGCSIGFAIARRMAQEGANVMVSSRKSENVEKAVHQLQSEGLDVRGVKCHVGDPKQRTNLITEVSEGSVILVETETTLKNIPLIADYLYLY